jgi:hypothetical protein
MLDDSLQGAAMEPVEKESSKKNTKTGNAK